jgi:hypothetical protein
MSYPAGAGADPGQADEAGAAGDAGGEGLTRPRETGHIQQARIAELPFDAAYKLMVTAAFDPSADLLPLITGLELLALVGIVDPPAPPPRRRSRRRRRPA